MAKSKQPKVENRIRNGNEEKINSKQSRELHKTHNEKKPL